MGARPPQDLREGEMAAPPTSLGASPMRSPPSAVVRRRWRAAVVGRRC